MLGNKIHFSSSAIWIVFHKSSHICRQNTTQLITEYSIVIGFVQRGLIQALNIATLIGKLHF